MAVKMVNEGKLGHSLHFYTDAVVDITSQLIGTPDVIIPWQKVAPGGKVNIAVRESNNKEVFIQPWIAIREPASLTDGDEIEYSAITPYWTIPANGRDHIIIDSNLDGLYYQVTGFVGAAVTAKVHCDMLITAPPSS